VPVTLATSAGQIDLTLDRDLAPCTVNSFAGLARQGYFDNTPCHRLTTSPGLQVLQCGDPTGTGSGGPGYKFNDETYPTLTYGRGYLAMANAGPNTNGSQFFIVTGDQGVALQPSYSLFGKVTSGVEVAKALEAVGTPGAGTPSEDVKIDSVTITES